MGNQTSSPEDAHFTSPTVTTENNNNDGNNNIDDRAKYRSFPGSAILEKTFCGSIDTTDPSEYQDQTLANRLLRKADIMCISSPDDRHADWNDQQDNDDDDDEGDPNNDKQIPHHRHSSPQSPSSRLLARALVSEVTDNPDTMKHQDLQARERQLLKAQAAAAAAASRRTAGGGGAVGTPGAGVGPPHVLQSFAYALTGQDDAPPTNLCLSQQAAAATVDADTVTDLGDSLHQHNPYAITIALCLSRRYADEGHPDTITRQTAYDFNQLQDRAYKYVSSTDKMGWRAGGGEGVVDASSQQQQQQPAVSSPGSAKQADEKVPHPDTAYIPILHMDCPNAETVDHVIHALASGDIFIPHMAVMPDALSVQGTPLPDLTVQWSCERNDDLPPDQWPNWCLEFMHNQLYEYFFNSPAQPIWMPRPFGLTLAKSVRWKTVKHMNKYFAHAEHVLEEWRARGPQFLDPQHSYMDGGASTEEVSRPHGIYLLRRTRPDSRLLVPTNYFRPNFSPPYTTKMTRSLLENVLVKSWNKSRREWSSRALPQLVNPTTLLAAACGCAADPTAGGFVAKEVTTVLPPDAQMTANDDDEHVVYSGDDNDGMYSDDDNNDEEEEEQEAGVYGKDVAKEQYGVAQQQQQEDDDDEDDSEDYHEKDEYSGESAENDDSEEDLALNPSQDDPFSEEGSEEKKTEEHDDDDVVAVEDVRKHTTRMSLDASTSGFMSVAASGTTVMHANKEQQQEEEEPRRLYSDEDWASTESSSHGLSSDPPGEKVSSPTWSSPKAKSPEKTPEHEKRRQRDLVTKSKDVVKPKPSSQYRMQPSPSHSQRKASPKVESVDSTTSLEYSADGSTHMGDASLFGQQFAADGSVSSGSRPAPDDDQASSLSFQTSTSSVVSVVPTDEELFAVGWAKALDPKSGNYYYFTLDRKTTVWENPLASSSSQQPVDAPGA